MSQRGRLGNIGLCAVVVVAAATACAPPPGGSALRAAASARWPMDEAGAPVMHDVSGSGWHGVIGASVAVGGGVYRFPGWSGNVDGNGHLSGTVDARAGAVEVPDPPGGLNPQRAGFVLSVLLRSQLTVGGLPSAAGASYNVVQKGRADDRSGFWKLELAGSGNEIGLLRWVLSDGRHSVVVTSGVRVDDGAWHTVTAERRGDRAYLTVDGTTMTASASALGAISPSGHYGRAMTIGKKPGSSDPRDAFAGWLDELAISAG